MNKEFNERLGVSPSLSYYGAPSVIEKAQHNMVSIDIYSKLLNENRIIFCNGEIESSMATDIVAQLLLLDSQNEPNKEPKPIKMYVNSPGGSVSAGLSIIDTMNVIKSPVHTICTGLAASMGSLILASGEKGFRRCLPHATIMIHQPSVGIGVMNTADLAIEAREMERVKKTTFQILSDATGKSLEEIYKDADRDCYLNAEEAKEYGIIDSIISK